MTDKRNTYRRYEVKKTKLTIGADTEVWLVNDRVGTGDERAAWDYTVQVWRSADGTCRCTRCSGPLSAMLTSCAHAKAVKRATDLQPTPEKYRRLAAIEANDVLVRLRRPEGYEDVHPELILQDANINPAFEPELVADNVNGAAQVEVIRELLDKHAPWAAGNLQTRIELVLNVLKVTANSAAGVDVPGEGKR